MKSIDYSRGLAFLILLLSLISSCKKDAGYLTPVPPSTSGGNNDTLKTLDTTVNLTVTPWDFNGDQSYRDLNVDQPYTVDISNLIYELVKTPFEIRTVYAKVNGQLECVCGEINYESGRLWATYSLNQCSISYTSPYGKPVFDVDLVIVLSN